MTATVTQLSPRAAAKKPRKAPVERRAMSKEEQEFQKLRTQERFITDLRDDTISLIRNEKLTFEEIEARGGPTAETLYKWLNREVIRPQTHTLRAALRVIGKDLGIVDGDKVVFVSGSTRMLTKYRAKRK